jgi:hypothetical protein
VSILYTLIASIDDNADKVWTLIVIPESGKDIGANMTVSVGANSNIVLSEACYFFAKDKSTSNFFTRFNRICFIVSND